MKNNLGKYLLLSATEDIYITKNGKVVAKLTNLNRDRVDLAKSLFGILPEDAESDQWDNNLLTVRICDSIMKKKQEYHME